MSDSLHIPSVCLSPSLPPMLSCGKCASSLCTTLSGDFHFMFTAQMRVCVCATIAIHSCFIHAGGSSTNFKFCIYLLSAVNALAFDARVSHWFATSIRTLWQATFTKVSMLPTNPASARYGRPGIVRRDGGSGCCLCGAQVCVVPWSQTGPCLAGRPVAVVEYSSGAQDRTA